MSKRPPKNTRSRTFGSLADYVRFLEEDDTLPESTRAEMIRSAREHDRLRREFTPESHEEAVANLTSDNEDILYITLVWIAYNEPDSRWAQNVFLEFTTHQSNRLRTWAVTFLGLLPTLHGWFDYKLVLPAIQSLMDDPVNEVSIRATEALQFIWTDLPLHVRWGIRFSNAIERFKKLPAIGIE